MAECAINGSQQQMEHNSLQIIACFWE